MDQVTVSRELLRQVIEKAEATTRHFNIERLGESTYKDTNTRCELHEAVNKLRVALEQPSVVPLTTEEYTDLAHRIASKYAHSSDPRHSAYTFLPHTLEQFVRGIEQAVRRKVGLK